MTIIEKRSDKTLISPVLVMALDGWIDAGMAAGGAIKHLMMASNAESFAEIESDSFLDQRSRRPILRINDGVNEGLTWPKIEIFAGTDLNGNDVLYLVGHEPDFNWRTFVKEIVAFSLGLDVRMVVGLGGFPAPAPHTRPVKLAATASSIELASKVGFVGGLIEVPAGVQAALEEGFISAAVPSIGLWARVPHYVAGMPFPGASAALVVGLREVADLNFDATALWSSADTTRAKVDELISESGDHMEMVHILEASIDKAEGNAMDLSDLPTGDEIADELERFLRGER